MERVELMTKAEAAELLRVSESTVEALIRSGQLPAYRIARACTRIDRADALAYLETRKVKIRSLQKVSSIKDIKRRQRIERMPSGYTPGMKVVDPYG